MNGENLIGALEKPVYLWRTIEGSYPMEITIKGIVSKLDGLKAQKAKLDEIEKYWRDILDKALVEDSTAFNRLDGRKWKEGDLRTIKNQKKPVFAGLFIYHGLGGGCYYSNTGAEVSTCRDEAYKLAQAEGLEFVFEDCM